MMFRKVNIILLVLLILTGIGRAEVSVLALTSKESIYPGLDLITVTNSSDTYTLSISTPYTNSEEINEAIVNLLLDQEKRFYKAITLYNDINDHHVRHHLNIQLETNRISEYAYYLTFNVYQFIGENSVERYSQSLLIDLEEEDVYLLPSIMNIQFSGD